MLALFVVAVATGQGSDSKSLGIADSADESDVETLPEWSLDPNHPEFLRESLNQYQLAPLSDNVPPDTAILIRFLWIRSFLRAVLFELKFKADGSGVFESNFWREKEGAVQWVTDRSKVLTSPDLKYYAVMIERYGLFELPWFDDVKHYDGAEWFIEIQQGEKYHAIYRDSPRSGPIWELGRGMIEGSIDSEYLPIY